MLVTKLVTHQQLMTLSIMVHRVLSPNSSLGQLSKSISVLLIIICHLGSCRGSFASWNWKHSRLYSFGWYWRRRNWKIFETCFIEWSSPSQTSTFSPLPKRKLSLKYFSYIEINSVFLLKWLRFWWLFDWRTLSLNIHFKSFWPSILVHGFATPIRLNVIYHRSPMTVNLRHTVCRIHITHLYYSLYTRPFGKIYAYWFIRRI